MLLAHVLRERGEGGEEEDESEDEYGEGGGEHRLARLLMGKRVMRRARARRMLLAHLLRERGEGGEEEDEGEDEYGEGGGGEHQLARLLIGKRAMRRGRARRMLVAHLLRERSEEEA
jgi:hypothetical protein